MSPADIEADTLALRNLIRECATTQAHHRSIMRDGGRIILNLRERMDPDAFIKLINGEFPEDAHQLIGWVTVAKMSDAQLDTLASAGSQRLMEMSKQVEGSTAERLNAIHANILQLDGMIQELAGKAGKVILEQAEESGADGLEPWLTEHFTGSSQDAGVYVAKATLSPARFRELQQANMQVLSDHFAKSTSGES